jgi:hypothetical protein
MGNLIPALFGLPLMAVGLVLMYRSGQVLGRELLWVVGGLALGWIAVNFFGLFQNRAMRHDMQMRLDARGGDQGRVKWFVGVATPTFVGVLDPHEDVGFLLLHDDRLEFFGEKLRVELPRATITAVTPRANVHTLIGLGRWIAVDATLEGRAARLLIELRERPTLLGNLRLSRKVMDRLRAFTNPNK